eukprot:gene703-biopygen7744
MAEAGKNEARVAVSHGSRGGCPPRNVMKANNSMMEAMGEQEPGEEGLGDLSHILGAGPREPCERAIEDGRCARFSFGPVTLPGPVRPAGLAQREHPAPRSRPLAAADPARLC